MTPPASNRIIEFAPDQVSRSGPPPPQPHFPHESNLVSNELSFKQYWGVIRKRRLLILSLALGAAVVALAWRLGRTPQYEATSTILIQPQTPQVAPENQHFSDQQSDYSGDYDYYRTQFDLLKSDSLAARVIHDYGLDANPLFNPAVQQAGLVASTTAFLSDEFASAASAKNDSSPATRPDVVHSRLAAMIKVYLARLTVAPIRGTRLVVVGFTTPNRALSARIVKGHVQTYIRQGLELNAQTGKNVEEFLQQTLGELRDKVETSEATLNSYRRSRGIVELESGEQRADAGDSPLMQRLTQLNHELTAAAARRITLETQHQMIAHGEYDALPEVISNQVIQNLKEQVAQLSTKHAGLSNRFNPGYHPLDDLTAGLEAARRALRSESQKVAASVNAEYEAAIANETRLGQEIDAVKAQTLALNDASLREAVLEREVNANRQLYRGVLERMNEIKVAAEVSASHVSVVDQATTPLAPVGPRLLLLLALSVGAGGLVGTALALLLESMNDSLKTSDEVPRYLGLPSLGVIPDFEKLDRLSDYPYPYLAALRWRGEATVPAVVSVDNRELMVAHGSFSVAAEVYRTIRAAIMFSRAGGAPRSLLITSSTGGEGKTITAVNIATAFAQTGARTILVDTDFRRARCHEILDIDSGRGLCEVLVRQNQFEEVVLSTKVPGLSFLAAGEMPPNPSELLASREMSALIHQLAESYDHVILDSAPVMPVSDSVGLSTMVEAVLVLAGVDTSRRLLRETCQRLGHVGARILGVILNRVDVVSNTYDRYNRYGYYHSYKPRKDRQTRAS
jgi:polysaccharide biosynthesis transport protein